MIKLFFALVLVSNLKGGCDRGKCQPSKGSRDYAVRSWWLKQQSDGYWIHHRQEGFLPATNYRFECKISDQELERFYDSISKK